MPVNGKLLIMSNQTRRFESYIIGPNPLAAHSRSAHHCAPHTPSRAPQPTSYSAEYFLAANEYGSLATPDHGALLDRSIPHDRKRK